MPSGRVPKAAGVAAEHGDGQDRAGILRRHERIERALLGIALRDMPLKRGKIGVIALVRTAGQQRHGEPISDGAARQLRCAALQKALTHAEQCPAALECLCRRRSYAAARQQCSAQQQDQNISHLLQGTCSSRFRSPSGPWDPLAAPWDPWDPWDPLGRPFRSSAGRRGASRRTSCRHSPHSRPPSPSARHGPSPASRGQAGSPARRARHSSSWTARRSRRPVAPKPVDILAPGQREAQRQHVAVAEHPFRQALAGVIAVDIIHPARAPGVVVLAEAVAAGRTRQ